MHTIGDKYFYPFDCYTYTDFLNHAKFIQEFLKILVFCNSMYFFIFFSKWKYKIKDVCIHVVVIATIVSLLTTFLCLLEKILHERKKLKNEIPQYFWKIIFLNFPENDFIFFHCMTLRSGELLSKICSFYYCEKINGKRFEVIIQNFILFFMCNIINKYM
ncbi:hypothetical protein RFI_34222 [Reticulomyxa filosa]|uniref:Uncharacterized protein n=1 Tax=Reticulomyxa filosa TaxID=46433 RepID=X6LML1_RETFI|nr:hypothetical protein RFI_34222 [Reticulomyxa filosa]|eukprot:ETO03188.1 hypothetical protein RFI_34222 [Reticulomyxa filosa]